MIVDAIRPGGCVLAIDNINKTLAEREVVNGIEQVGFALAVAPANTYNALRKLELLVKVVFKLEKRYGMQLQAQGKYLGFQRLHKFSNLESREDAVFNI